MLNVSGRLLTASVLNSKHLFIPNLCWNDSSYATSVLLPQAEYSVSQSTLCPIKQVPTKRQTTFMYSICSHHYLYVFSFILPLLNPKSGVLSAFFYLSAVVVILQARSHPLSIFVWRFFYPVHLVLFCRAAFNMPPFLSAIWVCVWAAKLLSGTCLSFTLMIMMTTLRGTLC